ncbi:MAG: GspE/PulE family protein [Pseudomonadota bacterium]
MYIGNKQSSGKLELLKVVKWLTKDQLINSDKLNFLDNISKHEYSIPAKKNSDLNTSDSSSYDFNKVHPFIYITQRKWVNEQTHLPMTMDNLMLWFSAKTGIKYYRIDPLHIDVPVITDIISISYAKYFNILPVEVTSTQLTIATAEPFQLDWKTEIARISAKNIQLVLVEPQLITRYIDEFYNVARSVIIAKSQNKNVNLKTQNFEQLLELGRKGDLDSNDHHIISIVDWLLQYAFEQRASDIHLEPRREIGNVRFRIDGKMQQVYEIPSVVLAAVSSRIKILARMDVAEKRRPQDGRIKTHDENHNEIELRLSTMPTAFGEKLVMRIFDPKVLQLDYQQLGFSTPNIDQWNNLIHQPNGLILVTGPTGSGKTSTLYTSLRQLATADVNVCTVEDPIEMVEPSFNQMQVHEQIDLTFASGIRTLLRQDPDIIMVGEIRDLKTAEMAIQAALTGHLVLSTLHTNDSASAIIRLLDLGIPYYLLQTSLLGVMAQRLVRVLCPHCKAETTINELSWQAFVQNNNISTPDLIYSAKGCHKCRFTGYIGRTGLYEILPITEQFKKLFSQHTDITVLREQVVKEQIDTIKISGIKKVITGITSIEEVMKVA